MKTTPLTLYIFNSGTPGGFLYPSGKRGARGQALAQNAAAAAAILEPRARRFEPRAVPSVPCQALCPVSGFRPWF